MNFKGNAFSAGSGKISDLRLKDGKINFLQAGGTSYNLRSFDIGTKKFSLQQKNVSFADKCFFYDDKLIEVFGMMLVEKP